jgi:Spy/CpxP family protein refolding chaperone
MNSMKLLCAAAMLAGTITAPAYAQMAADHAMKPMKMSMAQKKMMTKCKSMSHDMMMKSNGCMKMMKMHPDMMKTG